MKDTRSNPSVRDKFLSRNDLFLIAFLCLLALFALLYFRMHETKGSRIEVTIDGDLYGTYSLEEDQTIKIEGKDFISILEILDGEANMTDADCPDQICVNHRPITKKNETIVCLPHKLVVKVLDREDSVDRDTDVDIISK